MTPTLLEMLHGSTEPRPELYPYQVEGARFMAARKRALNADEMGLGKSAQAIYACDLLGLTRILVIAPAVARMNWKREFEKFQLIPRKVSVLERSDQRGLGDVLSVSFEFARSAPGYHYLTNVPFDAVIIDEAHYLKNMSSARSRAVYGKRATGEDCIVAGVPHVFALSGTPAPNNPSELYPMMRALFPESLTSSRTKKTYSKDGFVRRYCNVVSTGFGLKITGGRNLDELRERLEPYMIRRLQKDVLTELPPIRFFDMPLRASMKDLRAIERHPEYPLIQELLEADFSGSVEVAGSVAAVRRLIGLAKVPALVETLKEEFESGLGKIVLFAWHREVIETLVSELEAYNSVRVYGGMKPQAKQEAVDRFQEDPECRVFVGQISSAGTAITLTSAHEFIFVEADWVPGNNKQAAKRVHRIGQTKPVRVRFASVEKTIDSAMQHALRQKIKVLTKLFD